MLVSTLNKIFRRNVDKLIRLGGDEFCVLIYLPEDIDIQKNNFPRESETAGI